ncbi:hypothetical protein NG798_09770 [Ancylothrix sp. C2]|uniref:hypothetical protein n=1 Tax=Ancylothrix sp. D3o TaxID=2953691 RepID=UPI0021BA978A|nr:hypothetical protein [Ancylothrix sp. D3o]MCT7950072.1 hypothetical protein [Ancylothrix sp. D3o]
MAQQKTFDLAKLGNPQAIKVLMNQSLQPKGITVKVGLKNNCLMVIAESQTPPDQSFLVNFIRQGVGSLKPASVERVVVQAHTAGSSTPAWRTSFDLNAKVPASKTPPPVPTQAKKSPKNLDKPVESQPLNPFLKGTLLALKFLAYAVIFAVLVWLGFIIKMGALLIAESRIYNISILGDILQGIQVVEVLNVLVFAILGMGLGVAAGLLPKKSGIYAGAILVILSLPVLVVLSDVVKYNDWVNQVADVERVTYPQAEKITSSFLQSRVGSPGFLGFYLHTASYPVLPVKQVEMKEIRNPNLRVASRFSNFSKIEPQKIAALFSISGWGIRLFYFLVAVMTVIYHFQEGLKVVKIFPKGD